MNDTSREEFEKWGKDKGFKTDRLKLSNSYTGISTEYAWCGWQAAKAEQAALIAELVEALARVPSSLMITHNGQIGAFIKLNELDFLKRLLAKAKGIA